MLMDETGKNQADDYKNLKDFKNFISVKREPSAITAISTICYVFLLLLISGITGLILNTIHAAVANENAFSLFELTLET